MKTVRICINLILVFVILLVSSVVMPNEALASNPGQTREDPPDNTELVGWVNAGLYGATIRDVAIDVIHDTVFLTVAGGSYMSKDGGLSWQPITEFSSGPVISNPTTGTTYLGVWDEYASYEVWITYNGGSTWVQKTGFDALPWSFAIDPLDPLAIYMGTSDWDNTNGGKVYRSLDAGLNWTSATVDLDYMITSITVDPTNSNNILAVSGSWGNNPDHSAVYRSTNRGVSFSQILTSSNGYEYAHIGFDKFGRLILLGDGVRTSLDGGTTWSAEMLDGTIPSWDFHSLVFDPVSGRAYRSAYGTWYSDDGGVNWQPISLPRLVAFHPTDNQEIFAMNPPGLFKTVDGGSHWTDANTGLEHIVVEHLDGPSNADSVYATTHQGFGYSWNSGTTWQFPAGGGTFSLAVDPNINGKVYAENGHSSYHVSTDYGYSWSDPATEIIPTNGQITSMEVDPRDSNIIYAGLSTLRADPGNTDTTSGLYASEDGGAYWERVSLADKQVYVLEAAKHDTFIYIFAGLNYDADGIFQGGIYRGISGGDTWTYVGLSSSNINDIAVDPSDPDHILAAVGHWFPTDQPKGLYESFNSGDTWNKVTFYPANDLKASAVLFDPFDPQIIYLAAGFYLFRSRDGGLTWDYLLKTVGREMATLYVPYGTETRLFIGTGEGAFYRPLAKQGEFTYESGGFVQFEDALGFRAFLVDGGYAFTADTILSLVELPLQDMPGISGKLPWRFFQIYAYQAGSRLDWIDFDTPLTLTLTIPDPLRSSDDAFKLFIRDGDLWEDASCGTTNYDPASHTLTVQICQTGEFGLFREHYGIYLPLIIR
jgi:photosystem II stability/assembly factor-like uncharacterized protein